MKKVFIAALAVFCAMSVSAQRFGVKGGLNLSSYYGSDAGDAKARIGFNVGGLVELPLAEGFLLQPELILTMKGANMSNNSVEISMKPFYLDLPIKVMYKLNAGPGKLGLAVGPYVGYGLAGKYSMSTAGVSVSRNLFTKEDGASDAMLNRFDAGLASSVSYELRSGLFVSIDSELGLLKVLTGDENVKNNVMSLGLGYKF